MTDKGVITADDKVYDVITRYPQLKEVLTGLSKTYEKLNNPVIFNTVARVTPLSKAAAMGKIYLKELLYELNSAIGKGSEFMTYIKEEIAKDKDAFLQSRFGQAENTPEPGWTDQAAAWEVLDVRTATEDPFAKINSFAETLKAGEGFILVQKFQPLPLIAYLESRGFESFVKKVSDSEFRVYFRRNG